MKKLFEKLANMSAVQLWSLISHPDMIPVKMKSPPKVSATEAFALLFPEIDVPSIERLRMEFLENTVFFEELNNKMVRHRRRRISLREWHEFLYVAARACKPKVIFESGVFDGRSSAVFLQALKDNGDGELVSIDLPAVEAADRVIHGMDETLPPACEPGWVIPEYLRERHRLIVGDSKELLPRLFEEYPKIDIFFHDSLHTYEHQSYEYSAAWSHLKNGGLLLSDDIFWSSAFHRFCKAKNRAYVRIDDFGATKK